MCLIILKLYIYIEDKNYNASLNLRDTTIYEIT